MLPHLQLTHRRHRTVPALMCVVALLLGVAVVSAVQTLRATPAAAASKHDPVGKYDKLAVVGTDRVRVSGYAVDRDGTKAIKVRYRVDGRVVKTVIARTSRAEVARRWPAQGRKHGFQTVLKMAEGRHKVCVQALNRGKGRSVSLGCRSVRVANNPVGSLKSVQQTATGLSLSGRVVDPNSKSHAVRIGIRVNGKTRTTVHSKGGKASSGRAYSAKLTLSDGTYTVCAVAKNIGWGHNKQLGCKKITLNHRPLGAITSLKQSPGGFTVGGWIKDPDTSRAVTGVIYVDGASVARVTAAGSAAAGHGFRLTMTFPAEGPHEICVQGRNVGPGADRTVACSTITLNYAPVATVTGLKQYKDRALVSGWATDPDTSKAIQVRFQVDDEPVQTSVGDTVPAGNDAGAQGKHGFSAQVPITSNGTHEVCAIAVNTAYGTHDSIPNCRSASFNFNPVGGIDSAKRTATGSSIVRVTGYASDPNTAGPISVRVWIDGTGTDVKAIADRTHPTSGQHGFTADVDTGDQAEHQICVYGYNVGAGSNAKLACTDLWAATVTAPGAPTSVGAKAAYGQAGVSWTPPVSDGGAPLTKYTVTAQPGGKKIAVTAPATSVVVTGLALKTTYSFSVTATNAAGKSSAAVTSPKVTIPTAPPAQTTPAPVSTSRYVRNLKDDRTTDITTMRAQGAADAAANPAGHRYVILLDIGGQDQGRGGVVLSAGIRFVSYAWLVKGVKAYIDGYASKQRTGAPVEITIGTNNDMDVTYAAGQAWADKVVDPLRSYAASKSYPGMTISGANDIEPGFDASYASTKKWLQGYLDNTTARFVFNGSADGCAWTATNRGCNNGWTMAGLQYLAGGAAPDRITNLPQIYNTTMPKQWKYISLTGVEKGLPKLRFGGPLTELTACRQAGSCSSIDGKSAWTQLWNQLASDTRSKLSTMPWVTDLRIDLK